MKFSQLFVLLIIALQFVVAQGLIYDAKAIAKGKGKPFRALNIWYLSWATM
uniref:Putative esophageal gland cell secretory protein 22 n=1 Tax=Meloidogyne incognita TaxID=6306 RepID=Q7YWI9_MELIC|nr:putative esophageal gland cell secretory protein 22 [Meloidogyne incognita]